MSDSLHHPAADFHDPGGLGHAAAAAASYHHPYSTHGLVSSDARLLAATQPHHFAMYEQELLRQQQQQQLLAANRLHPEDAVRLRESSPVRQHLSETYSARSNHEASTAIASVVTNTPESLEGVAGGKRKQPPSQSKQQQTSSVSGRKPRKKSRSNSTNKESIQTSASKLPPSPPSPPATTQPLEAMAHAADMVAPITQQQRTVTLHTLVQAAEEVDQRDEDAKLLAVVFQSVQPWKDDDEEEAIPPAEQITTPFFASAIPAFPTNKTWKWPLFRVGAHDKDEEQKSVEANHKKPEAFRGGGKSNDHISSKELEPGVLELSYPVDDWWPTANGLKLERRENGDDPTDEDETTITGGNSRYHANTPKIRHGLSCKLEPGVLEKVPHCRLHRARTARRQKNLGVSPAAITPELVSCSQVTELYPNEVMVNCSVCGTWRHAACGGHYENFSINKDGNEVDEMNGGNDDDCGGGNRHNFAAICELCHAERPYLEAHRTGAARLDRQRREHIRRGLATSAVMRHFSYSKHGGTYKWPLGSVSATHINGHTRSVLSRHEKADKQWADMVERLSREFGYRPKACVKTRTKEFERLLAAIEDAESYTDRHNMYLFLRRDTARDKPVGWEQEGRNLMDPADDPEADLLRPSCLRPGCIGHQRFDSRFCSEACGVATMELELMRTLETASELHPSILRSTF